MQMQGSYVSGFFIGLWVLGVGGFEGVFFGVDEFGLEVRGVR